MKRKVLTIVGLIAVVAIMAINVQILTDDHQITDVSLKSIINQAWAQTMEYDALAYWDFDENKDMGPVQIPVDGVECYAPYTRTTSVGGYTETSTSSYSGNTTTITISITNIGENTSVSTGTEKGTTEGVTWGTEETRIFIGLTTICKDNYVLTSGTCRAISCEEMIHTMY